MICNHTLHQLTPLANSRNRRGIIKDFHTSDLILWHSSCVQRVNYQHYYNTGQGCQGLFHACIELQKSRENEASVCQHNGSQTYANRRTSELHTLLYIYTPIHMYIILLQGLLQQTKSQVILFISHSLKVSSLRNVLHFIHVGYHTVRQVLYYMQCYCESFTGVLQNKLLHIKSIQCTEYMYMYVLYHYRQICMSLSIGKEQNLVCTISEGKQSFGKQSLYTVKQYTPCFSGHNAATLYSLSIGNALLGSLS